MLKIILDTNVLVAGLSSSSGASFKVLESIGNGAVSLVASTAIWLEYEAVLKRDEIRSMHGFSLTQIDEILSALAVWVTPVTLHFAWRPQLRDPGDEMVLEAAANAQVDFIVTHNRRDFESVAPAFGIGVASPVQLITLMKDDI